MADSVPAPQAPLPVPDLTGKPLEIKSSQDGDSLVINVSGELDLATAADVDGVIRDVEETDIGRIVVDLSDLSFVDCAGLKTLLAAKFRSDGRLAFLPPRHESVTRLLDLTGTAEMLGSPVADCRTPFNGERRTLSVSS